MCVSVFSFTCCGKVCIVHKLRREEANHKDQGSDQAWLIPTILTMCTSRCSNCAPSDKQMRLSRPKHAQWTRHSGGSPKFLLEVSGGQIRFLLSCREFGAQNKSQCTPSGTQSGKTLHLSQHKPDPWTWHFAGSPKCQFQVANKVT